MNGQVGTIKIEGAKLMYKNFAGKATKFSPEGRRTFCVALDQDFANKLAEDGWNIKYRVPKDPDEDPLPYIQIKLNFAGPYPPTIYLISGDKKTKIDEDSINVLDFAEILNADLVARPYMWTVGNKSGLAAYLKSLYVTVAVDEFEAKYMDIPEDVNDPELPWVEE